MAHMSERRHAGGRARLLAALALALLWPMSVDGATIRAVDTEYQRISLAAPGNAFVGVTTAHIRLRADEALALRRPTNSSLGLFRLICGSTVLESFPERGRDLDAFFPAFLVPTWPVPAVATPTVLDLADRPLYALSLLARGSRRR